MTNVQVLDITPHEVCQTFHAVQLRADPGPQTVTITGSTINDFQRTGLLVQGNVTVDATGNTFGPPDLSLNPDGVAQNTIQIGSPAIALPSHGKLENNTIIGSSYGRPAAASDAILFAGASGVTVTKNTFEGDGTDVGVDFVLTNTDIVVSYNAIDRSPQDRPGFEDTAGFGVRVNDASVPGTTLICNSFHGWNQNLVNITQPLCITTPAELPCVTVDQPASLQLQAFVPVGALTWRLVDGELPPGLTLNENGTVTGTPTEVGTTTATIEATDSAENTDSVTFTFCVQAQPTPPPGPGPAPKPKPKPHHPVKPHRPHRELARTGTDAGELAGMAFVLLGSGGLLVRRTRRRLSDRTR